MPNQSYRTNSARINFGIPNSEYIVRVNSDTGEALSCYNQDTGTEYIGGGGGGGSDFSTAEVKIINNTGSRIYAQFPQCVEENELTEGVPALITNTESFPVGETTIKIPLYKGHALLTKTTEASIEVTGDIVTIGSSEIAVSGNGTITFKAQQ